MGRPTTSNGRVNGPYARKHEAGSSTSTSNHINLFLLHKTPLSVVPKETQTQRVDEWEEEEADGDGRIGSSLFICRTIEEEPQLR
ncbi:hypothetical protein NQZ68_005931 [Dissostichus eleginoides]|nr:hypothetical protein NQZ68_005931 [Dissostichus eleginoides]